MTTPEDPRRALTDLAHLAELLSSGIELLLGAFDRALRGPAALPEEGAWEHPSGARVDRAVLLAMEAALSYRSALLEAHPENLFPLLHELLAHADGPSGGSLRALCDHWRGAHQGPWLRRIDRPTERPWHMHHFARRAPFALSPDCAALAHTDGNDTVVLDTRTAWETFRTPGVPLGLAAEGKRLAVAVGSSVTLWDVPSGTRVGAWEAPSRELNSLALDLRGELVALLFSDQLSVHGEALGTLQAAIPPGLSCKRLSFTSDGGLFVEAHATLLRVDPSTGAVVSRWDAPSGSYLEGVAFSADHSRLAVCPSGKSAFLLDAGTLQVLHRWDLHTWLRSSGVALSPDGKLLAVTMENTTLRLLWTPDGAVLRDLASGGGAPSFDARCQHMHSGGGLWNPWSGCREATLLARGGPPWRLWFSPQGDVAVGETRGWVSVWDPRRWAKESHLVIHPSVQHVRLVPEARSAVAESVAAFSAWSTEDGRCRCRRSGRVVGAYGKGRLLVATAERPYGAEGFEFVEVGDEVTSTVLETGGVEGTALFNAARGQVLVSTADGRLHAFALDPLRRQFQRAGAKVSLHHQGELVGCEAQGETLFVAWDSGEPVVRLPVDGAALRDLSPDGTLAVVLRSNQDVQLWRTHPPALQCRLELANSYNTLEAVAFVDNGAKVETVHSEIHHITDSGPTTVFTHWSVETGARLGSVDPHHEELQAAPPARFRWQQGWHENDLTKVLTADGAVLARASRKVTDASMVAGRYVLAGVDLGGVALYELLGIPTPKDPISP